MKSFFLPVRLSRQRYNPFNRRKHNTSPNPEIKAFVFMSPNNAYSDEQVVRDCHNAVFSCFPISFGKGCHSVTKSHFDVSENTSVNSLRSVPLLLYIIGERRKKLIFFGK